MTGYRLDNSWDRARRRLELLELYLDPISKRRFAGFSRLEGARCLEVGAGGGSIARWLIGQVGPTGSVVATDINTRFLEDLDAPNFEAIEHDILTEDLPRRDFDFAHARWILHHLPEPEVAIRRMIDALRPGGWLFLEEVDFYPVEASGSADYRAFMTALVNTVVKASGRTAFWARALPGIVAGMGLADIGGEGDVSLLRGGGPVAEFFSLTAEQMREAMIAEGAISPDRLDRALRLLDDPGFFAFGGGGVAVWGRKPS